MRTCRAVALGCLFLAASSHEGDALGHRDAAAADRPNILLIVMDDLGYGDLGISGAPDAKTAYIDRLAREGVRLTDAYANAAVCSPTRAALITGRYQQRVDIEWALHDGDVNR